MLGEFDDQDRVLGRQADQHDEADLRIDVHLHAAQPDGEQRAEQSGWHRQNHHERHRPALVLRGQDQEHEDDGECEDQNGDRACLQLLVGDARPFEAEVVRQRGRGRPLHGLDGLAG